MPERHLSPPPDDRTLRRIRNALLFMSAALVALAAFQTSHNARLERVREIDLQLAGIANLQGAFSQQVGRFAALVAVGALNRAEDTTMLDDALARSRAEALRFDTLLQRQAALSGAADPGIADALERWQQARDRLWHDAQALLWHLELAEIEQAAADARAAQRGVDAALESATSLALRLEVAARERSRQQAAVLETGVGLTLLVLAAVALFVAVPTARTLRSQMTRLSQQTSELARLALVAARTDNAVVVTDARGRIDWVNDAFARHTGWTLAEARGRYLPALLHGTHDERAVLRRIVAALAAGEGVRAELRVAHREGCDFWADVDVQPLCDAQGRPCGCVALATDISERRELQRRLAHDAATDALTGLPNRAAAVERLRRAIAHARRNPRYGFAVLFMDFDRFKQINDTLGHGEGDRLLQQMAGRIENALRPGDAVARVGGESAAVPASDAHTAARLGGDEFVVVLDGIGDAAAALAVAGRLLRELAEPYALQDRLVQSSASIGVVVVASGDDRSPDDLLRDADTAMYEAKRAGRDRCVLFDPVMHERVASRLELENDLRAALREHRFFVVYQPIVTLPGGRVSGVEALVRWRHPTRGVVAPGEFIDVAEETGLIGAIGEVVLREACSRMADWRHRLGAAAPQRLNVNLSRAQLLAPGIADLVATVLAENQLPPELLQLEITESLAAQDHEVQGALRQLKALGVRLALDDFGTGYSSLACLHLFPVDTVKIDRSFVMHAESAEYHRVLIESTIRVAQSLGMKTVAEGIETPGQAALMQQLCCDHGQGWHFGRPVAAAEVEPLFSETVTA